MKALSFWNVLLLQVLFSRIVTAQIQSGAPSTTHTTFATSTISITPEMSASSVSSVFASLATVSPLQPGGPTPGDAGSSGGNGQVDTDAGASGPDSGSIQLSRGAIIAIIVVACSICIFGAASAVLFYLAKKRDWQIRASIRKSARRVATALTPRRSTFPKDMHSKRRASTRGLTKIEEYPNSPRPDVEKGNVKMTPFEMSEPPKNSKWARKFGR